MKKVYLLFFVFCLSISLIYAQPPAYAIGLVTTVDENGLADSLEVECQLQGIVYGVNLRPGGLEFTIIDDQNDGIGVFSSQEDFGYSVAEGDEVIVQGTIGHFRGLTQISPDTVWKVSEGNALVEPAVVTTLGEETESQLIRLENVSLVDPAQWDPSGSGFDVEVTDGTNTYAMRIDRDLDVFDEANPPSGMFTLTGLGRQFDDSEPYTEGYQIMPRYKADIDPYVPAEPDIPFYTIGTITSNNADGEPDSLGVVCQTRGIVHSVNFRPGGLEVHIIDENEDGVVIFNNGEDFGYVSALGDELLVTGELDFFRGLTELIVDTLEVLSSSNMLFEPRVVTDLDESTEAQLVKINNVSLVDASQWNPSGSGFNVDVTDGTNTYEMRIDADIDLYNASAEDLPAAFNLTGVGSQFDRDAPYDSGYQILPRSSGDIEAISNVYDALIGHQLSVFPNPVAKRLTIQAGQALDGIQLVNAQGQILRSWREIPAGTQNVDLSDLNDGLYVLRFFIEGRFWTTKIVKE